MKFHNVLLVGKDLLIISQWTGIMSIPLCWEKPLRGWLFQSADICGRCPGGGQAGHPRFVAGGHIRNRIPDIVKFIFVQAEVMQKFFNGFRLVWFVFRSGLDGTEQIPHAELLKRDAAAFVSLPGNQGDKHASLLQGFYQFTYTFIRRRA